MASSAAQPRSGHSASSSERSGGSARRSVLNQAAVRGALSGGASGDADADARRGSARRRRALHACGAAQGTGGASGGMGSALCAAMMSHHSRRALQRCMLPAGGALPDVHAVVFHLRSLGGDARSGGDASPATDADALLPGLPLLIARLRAARVPVAALLTVNGAAAAPEDAAACVAALSADGEDGALVAAALRIAPPLTHARDAAAAEVLLCETSDAAATLRDAAQRWGLSADAVAGAWRGVVPAVALSMR